MAVPGVPTGLSISSIWSNVFAVSWNAVGGADGYYVYYSEDDSTFFKVFDTEGLNGHIRSLVAATQYYVKVSAYNADGEGSLSSSINDTTLAYDEKYYIKMPGEVSSFDGNSLIVSGSRALEGIYNSYTDAGNKATFFSSIFYYIYGDPDENGTWRITLDGSDLVFQRRESGVWVTKTTFISGGSSIRETTRIINTDSPYAVVILDHIIFCDTDAGAIEVDLAAGVEGRSLKIINCGSSGNDVTVDPNGTEQLYGAGAGVASTLADGEVIDIHYNATEGWW